MTPPLEQHGIADELEPWRELQLRPPKHLLQLVRGHVAGVSHFVGVDIEVNVRLDEEDIVHCLN